MRRSGGCLTGMSPATALLLTAGIAATGIVGLSLLIGRPARAGEGGARIPRPGRLGITVDTDRPVGSCYRFWNVSVFTSQHRFVDESYTRNLKRDKPFMKAANCVRLLGGRNDERNKWYKGVDEKGNVRTDFTGLVSYLGAMIDLGYTPRLVLDNVPTAMSAMEKLNYYGNTNPPDDYDLWRQFITALVETLVGEFGLERVSTWRFRVGTEPDLFPSHWNGTREQYFKHYDVTVDAVTRIIPNADIGPGNILKPGGFKARWGLDIIDHCARGTNHVTGRPGSRMKYFSISFYGAVGQPLTLEESIRPVRERLDRYPEFRGIPLDIQEFGILHDEYRKRLWGNDITEWGASWYAAVTDIIYRNRVAEAYEWRQVTGGLLHPRLQVTRMLEMMAEGERLHVEATGKATGRAGVVACTKEGKVYLLLYNHHPTRAPKVRNTLSISVRGGRVAKTDAWRMNEWSIDRDHGVWVHEAYRDLERAGLEPLPNSPVYGGLFSKRFGKRWREVFAENKAKYEALAVLPRTAEGEPVSSREGVIAVEYDMPGHSVKLIEFVPGGSQP